jgi:predicted enzyme related to lactoylglutathione lyase
VSCRLVALRVDSHDPLALAAFWGRLLRRPVHDEPSGPLLAGGGGQVGLRFVPSDGVRTGPGRVHLHVTSSSAADQQATVTTVLALGGRHLDVGQTAEEGHVVLADPEGNEFCVVEPDNSFLEGCGPLGELAGDGTREVGHFWSRALQWPLVWDEQGETAVQSPEGGTKVAWGGPPVAPKAARNRQRLEVAVASGSAGAEVDRLLGLGARPSGPADGSEHELLDPDGNEFHLTTA